MWTAFVALPGKVTLRCYMITKTYLFCPPCVKKQGLSDAQFRRYHNFELCIRYPLFFYIGVQNIFRIENMFKSIIHKLRIQTCLFFVLISMNSERPRKIGKFPEVSIAWQKCLCLSRKVVLFSKHFDISTLVSMFSL